jgi:hypothetical protein
MENVFYRMPEKVDGVCPKCKKENLHNVELFHTSIIECGCGYACSVGEYVVNIKNKKNYERDIKKNNY